MTGTNYPQLKAGLLDESYKDVTREYVLTTFEGSIINTRQIMRICSAYPVWLLSHFAAQKSASFRLFTTSIRHAFGRNGVAVDSPMEN